MKAFVVYDTKYGNTKLVAETIVAGLKELEGMETTISDIEELDMDNIPDFDLVLIGSPNHMGGPVRGITRFIDELGRLDMEGKQVAVFDTYMGGDFNKAVSKMEARIKQMAPSLRLISPGLSIRVEGMKGPIAEGELPKCREFGKNLKDQLKT